MTTTVLPGYVRKTSRRHGRGHDGIADRIALVIGYKQFFAADIQAHAQAHVLDDLGDAGKLCSPGAKLFCRIETLLASTRALRGTASTFSASSSWGRTSTAGA